MIHYWPWGDSTVLTNVATWYLSVLLLSGLLLYSLGKRTPAFLKEIVIPISIVVFFCYSYRNHHSLAKDDIVGVYFHIRFFRGFSEMGLGMLLYDLNKKISVYLKTVFFRVFGFSLLTAVVVCSFFWHGDADYLYVLMIAVAIPICFNAPLPGANKLISFFDKISYSVFLNHIVIRTYLFPFLFDEITLFTCVAYLICVTAFSIAMFFSPVGLAQNSSGCFSPFLVFPSLIQLVTNDRTDNQAAWRWKTIWVCTQYIASSCKMRRWILSAG